MATESLAIDSNSSEIGSYCSLWDVINQLEAVLEACVDAAIHLPVSDDKSANREMNHVQALALAAQTLADLLAHKAGVR